MTDKATDKRPQFVLIEDAVIEKYDLDPYTGWLYVVIVKHANKKTGEAFPGIARLAKLCKMSRSQVMRGIATLEAKGLIRVERDEKPLKGEKRQRLVNHYYVLPVSSQGVVSISDYPSSSERLGVVSTSDFNQNHLEPELVEVGAPAAKIIDDGSDTLRPTPEQIVQMWLKTAAKHAPLVYSHPRCLAAAATLLGTYPALTLDDVRICTLTQCKNRTTDYMFSFLVEDLSGYMARKAVQPAPAPQGLDDFSKYRLEMMKQEKAEREAAS